MRVSAATGDGLYEFAGGYPTPETVRRAYDEADLNRAVQAYRFFYPSVSIMATWKGNLRSGMVANKVFGLLEGTPKQYVFTPNSDTPYSGLPLDVSDGPMVLEFPPGPLMSTANDLNQRWVIDMGLPGPDQGQGGKHLVLPPGYDGEVPAGFNVGPPDHQPGPGAVAGTAPGQGHGRCDRADEVGQGVPAGDRKSTRLNSSHRR